MLKKRKSFLSKFRQRNNCIFYCFMWGSTFSVCLTQKVPVGCAALQRQALPGVLGSGFQCALCRPSHLSERTTGREIHLVYCKTWKCNYVICNWNEALTLKFKLLNHLIWCLHIALYILYFLWLYLLLPVMAETMHWSFQVFHSYFCGTLCIATSIAYWLKLGAKHFRFNCIF